MRAGWVTERARAAETGGTGVGWAAGELMRGGRGDGGARDWGEKKSPASDMGDRNRTPVANVPQWTDDATRGHPPDPGVVQKKEGKHGC